MFIQNRLNLRFRAIKSLINSKRTSTLTILNTHLCSVLLSLSAVNHCNVIDQHMYREYFIHQWLQSCYFVHRMHNSVHRFGEEIINSQQLAGNAPSNRAVQHPLTYQHLLIGIFVSSNDKLITNLIIYETRNRPHSLIKCLRSQSGPSFCDRCITSKTGGLVQTWNESECCKQLQPTSYFSTFGVKHMATVVLFSVL